jgi:predicted nuclease with TOPRIM domain
MQVQLDEVGKENAIIKRSNTQLAGKLEDAETRLVEIQLNLESSHANDSSVAQGGEAEMLKLKIETMEVELEELKNINEFNDEILNHKEDDIDKLDQKCGDLSHLNFQLMTRLEIMNRELNEMKIVTEGFDTKSEAGSASTGSGDSTGFTSVRGPESATLGNNDAAPHGGPHVSCGTGTDLLKRMIGFGGLVNFFHILS